MMSREQIMANKDVSVNNNISSNKETSTRKRLYFSVLLAAMAFVSLTVATVAWFTIADFTKVHSMGIDITTGINLRFDLDSHSVFTDYTKALNFGEIADRMLRDKGFDMRQVPLEPVTTSDGLTFTYENGKVVDSNKGAYLEFVLHFMGTDDMFVHLTSASDQGQTNGTEVSSSDENLPKAMRISFTVDGKSYVYNPGMGDKRVQQGSLTEFGLAPASQMVTGVNNELFWLERDIDKPVTVRIWLEGSDPACTDEVRNTDYGIRLRFVGTDENHNIISGKGNE